MNDSIGGVEALASALAGAEPKFVAAMIGLLAGERLHEVLGGTEGSLTLTLKHPRIDPSDIEFETEAFEYPWGDLEGMARRDQAIMARAQAGWFIDREHSFGSYVDINDSSKGMLCHTEIRFWREREKESEE